MRVGVVLGRGRAGERSHVDRVAEAEVVRLDGEDVREVRCELQLDVQLDLAGSEVAHDELLLEPDRDPAPANDLQLIVLEPARERVAAEVGGRVGVAAPSRQELGPGAVDEQDEARQETRVMGEEPGGREVDVAALVGDAERRPGENRLRHGAREYPLSRGCAELPLRVCISSKGLFYSAAGNLWNRFHRLQLFTRRGT